MSARKKRSSSPKGQPMLPDDPPLSPCPAKPRKWLLALAIALEAAWLAFLAALAVLS